MPSQSTPAEIARAAAILRTGGLVGFPTETVYGLGADASNPAAVAKIFAAKGRPQDHPLIVHLGSMDLLPLWAAQIPAAAHKLAAAFWPGPLTLILKRAAGVSDCVTGGQDTVGLRIPGHPVALELLRAFAGEAGGQRYSGIAAPSANKFGRISPTTAEHVRAELGAAVDAVLDGGDCEVGIESTIVDLSRGRAVLLRPGRSRPRRSRRSWAPKWSCRMRPRRVRRARSKATMRRARRSIWWLPRSCRRGWPRCADGRSPCSRVRKRLPGCRTSTGRRRRARWQAMRTSSTPACAVSTIWVAN